MRFFVGGYAPEIAVAELDPDDGSMEVVKRVTTPENASFLVACSKLKTLYATVETGYQSGGSGKVSSYRVDAELMLTALGSTESCGPGPCHADVVPEEGLLAVANYGGENFSLIKLDDSGKPVSQLACVTHSGQSVNPDRQAEPHPHATVFSPDASYLFVCDLGIDQVVRYSVSSLLRGEGEGVVAAEVSAGSGPRHLSFSADARHAYLVNELSNTVVAYAYDPATGDLSELQEIGMLPASFDGENTAAEIAIHPSGRFVYASNRGHDTIACYTRDAESGKLSANGYVDTTGSGPRHFGIDPTGLWMLVANQNTDQVVSMKIDPETGVPKWTGKSLGFPAASCALFWPTERQP
ncbi:MAG: lactonase family protein [Spirochaetales bacterium]